MTRTLLMRLEGPMQSWGVQSRFEVRDTGTEPSKSGVIGLVCAALGRDRSEPIDDLRALRMGVRVDRPGSMMRDYQTAVRWKRDRKEGSYNEGGTTLSERYYLADASFLVGLEGEDLSLLESIDDALKRPRWPLSLGRKAFPPTAPISIAGGIVDEPLESALRRAPIQPIRKRDRDNEEIRRVRLVIERGNEQDDGLVVHRRPDQPISFEPRRFSSREVVVSFMEVVPPASEEVSDVPE